MVKLKFVCHEACSVGNLRVGSRDVWFHRSRTYAGAAKMQDEFVWMFCMRMLSLSCECCGAYSSVTTRPCLCVVVYLDLSCIFSVGVVFLIGEMQVLYGWSSMSSFDKTDIVDVDEVGTPARKSSRKWSTGVLALGVAAALAIGGGVGYVVSQRMSSSLTSAISSGTVAKDGLDEPIAYYDTGGGMTFVTVREVIEADSNLESVEGEHGYAVPSADRVLAYVRNKVIAKAADDAKITVTDDELSKYAEKTLGTSDFKTIAESYGMDEEHTKAIILESARTQKLRESVVGTTDEGVVPELPEEPVVDGAENMSEKELDEAHKKANAKIDKKYADYIIALVGDEWDAKKGAWASDDGVFAQALSSYEVTPKGASYDAALTAYYIAYQNWSQSASEEETVWSDYVNDLFDDVTLMMRSLGA